MQSKSEASIGMQRPQFQILPRPAFVGVNRGSELGRANTLKYSVDILLNAYVLNTMVLETKSAKLRVVDDNFDRQCTS